MAKLTKEDREYFESRVCAALSLGSGGTLADVAERAGLATDVTQAALRRLAKAQRAWYVGGLWKRKPKARSAAEQAERAANAAERRPQPGETPAQWAKRTSEEQNARAWKAKRGAKTTGDVRAIEGAARVANAIAAASGQAKRGGA